MELEINAEKLRDSPYVNSNNPIFIFDQLIIDELVQDIKFGNPTCYLISGYRGAGKSSFVKKVETTIIEINKQRITKNLKTAETNIVFVHESFAKYQSHSFLLRKLIRGLYQTLISEDNIKKYKQLKENEKTLQDDKKISLALETLYEKTFNETSNSETQQSKAEKGFKLNIDILKLISFGSIFLLSLFNIFYKWFENLIFLNIVVLIASLIAIAKEIAHLDFFKTKTDSEEKEFQRKSLYDDEIADYHFNNILTGLLKNNFKIVFVLDELDKIDEEDVSNLIKEMKPHLVSGLASFIIVAGQEFYYKYQFSESIDDAILTTLFSKIIHIPLLSIPDFFNLFNSIISFEEEEGVAPDRLADALNDYVNFLIFKSKRVPRKFINLIRHNIKWKENKAFLEINLSSEQNKVYSKIIESISKIDGEQVSMDFSDGLRDYFIMQLFIKSEKILQMSGRNRTFSKDDLN